MGLYETTGLSIDVRLSSLLSMVFIANEIVLRYRLAIVIPFHFDDRRPCDGAIEDGTPARIYDMHLRMDVHREVGVDVQLDFYLLIAILIGRLAYLEA